MTSLDLKSILVKKKEKKNRKKKKEREKSHQLRKEEHCCQTNISPIRVEATMMITAMIAKPTSYFLCSMLLFLSKTAQSPHRQSLMLLALNGAEGNSVGAPD